MELYFKDNNGNKKVLDVLANDRIFSLDKYTNKQYFNSVILDRDEKKWLRDFCRDKISEDSPLNANNIYKFFCSYSNHIGSCGKMCSHWFSQNDEQSLQCFDKLYDGFFEYYNGNSVYGNLVFENYTPPYSSKVRFREGDNKSINQKRYYRFRIDERSINDVLEYIGSMSRKDLYALSVEKGFDSKKINQCMRDFKTTETREAKRLLGLDKWGRIALAYQYYRLSNDTDLSFEDYMRNLYLHIFIETVDGMLKEFVITQSLQKEYPMFVFKQSVNSVDDAKFNIDFFIEFNGGVIPCQIKPHTTFLGSVATNSSLRDDRINFINKEKELYEVRNRYNFFPKSVCDENERIKIHYVIYKRKENDERCTEVELFINGKHPFFGIDDLQDEYGNTRCQYRDGTLYINNIPCQSNVYRL